jgi:hypothetical protein
MLGLSSSIMHSAYIQPVETGWLKVVYGSTQNSTAFEFGSTYFDNFPRQTPGFGINDFFPSVPPSVVGSSGDITEIDFRIYIDNYDGKWDPQGDSDDFSIHLVPFGPSTINPSDNHILISVNQEQSISTVLTTNSGNTSRDLYLMKFYDNDDMPQAGATFYIKDIVLRANRRVGASDNIIATWNSDFTGGVDDNHDSAINVTPSLPGGMSISFFDTTGTITKTTNQSLP